MYTSYLLTCSILALLAGLDASHANRRNECKVRLGRLLPYSLPYLYEAEGKLPPRADITATHLLDTSLLEHCRAHSALALPDNWPRLTWLDMLPAGWPRRQELLDHYLAEANKLHRERRAVQEGEEEDGGWREDPTLTSPHWEQYRTATRLLLSDLYRTGYSRQDVRKLLHDMALNEYAWLRDHGYKFNPPAFAPCVPAGSAP